MIMIVCRSSSRYIKYYVLTPVYSRRRPRTRTRTARGLRLTKVGSRPSRVTLPCSLQVCTALGSGNRAAQHFSMVGSPWACEACTYDNHPSIIECEMCHRERPSHQLQTDHDGPGAPGLVIQTHCVISTPCFFITSCCDIPERFQVQRRAPTPRLI